MSKASFLILLNLEKMNIYQISSIFISEVPEQEVLGEIIKRVGYLIRNREEGGGEHEVG